MTELLRHHDIGIMCLTETWLQDDLDSRFLVFPGYRVLRRDRPARDGRRVRGGGICALFKADLRVEQLAVPSSGSPLESLWFSVCGGQSRVIGVCYRPPVVTLNTTMDDLQEQLVHALGLCTSLSDCFTTTELSWHTCSSRSCARSSAVGGTASMGRGHSSRTACATQTSGARSTRHLGDGQNPACMQRRSG